MSPLSASLSGAEIRTERAKNQVSGSGAVSGRAGAAKYGGAGGRGAVSGGYRNRYDDAMAGLCSLFFLTPIFIRPIDMVSTSTKLIFAKLSGLVESRL